MSEKFFGNKKACTILNKYMECACTGNLVLSGPKGVGKALIAQKIAAHILNCETEKLELHPDFIFLNPENGQIKSDMVQDMLEHCKYTAAIAERKVVLIDDADCLNQAAQNKLLKEIEENRGITFIFVAHGKLLDTIISRCFPISFEKINTSEMMKFFEEIGEKNENLYLPICNGSIGNYYKYKKMPVMMESIENIIRHFSVNSNQALCSQILCVCGQMIEKDKQNIYECFGKQMDPFFQLFEAIFYGLFLHMTGVDTSQHTEKLLDYSNMEKVYSMGLVINILSAIRKHATMYRCGIYTKNDFFRLLRLMA